MTSTAELVRFLRWFTSVAFGGLILIASFNLGVDSYDRFGLNRLGVYVSAAREVKLRRAGEFPHDGLLVGNSRSAMIPVSQLHGRRFFNAGLDAASLTDVRRFLERNLRPHELVLLNLDHIILYPYSEPQSVIAFEPLSPDTLGSYLLSFHALRSSFRTLSEHFAGTESNYESDGTSRDGAWRKAHAVDDPTWVRNELAVKSNYAAAFRWNPQHLEELRRIRSLVQERQGELVVFFSPVAEDILPFLESETAGAEWKKAVSEIQTLFPDTIDLTRSVYSSRTNFFPTDLAHYFPEVGVRVLNEAVLPRVNLAPKSPAN